MKTKSMWGNPPKRLYNLINIIKKNIGVEAKICIVGCSDGKFVLPFLRSGFKVSAFDFDKIALYGGEKTKPKERKIIKKIKYESSEFKPKYKTLETENIVIKGLQRRALDEGVIENLNIQEKDFYRSSIDEKFDLIFTSCSIQYKSNRDMSVESILNTIKDRVKINGYIYMDYMMPLEDRHTFKCEHFFRTGEIKKYFSKDQWEIVHLKELKKPVFEAAHIDRPEDHFHRFGYILAKKI